METIVKRISKYFQSNNNISNFIIRKIYNYRYKEYSFIGSLVDYTNYCGTLLIKEDSYNSFPPKEGMEKSPHITANKTPNVQFFTFDNAIVHTDSTCIQHNNKILVTREGDERFNEGFIKFHNKQHAKIIYPTIEDIDEGFFLSGNGSWNWYHFLIEILPKVLLLEKPPKIFLVSEVVKQFPTMEEALHLILPKNSEIKYLSRKKSYRVKKLTYINDFNHLQFNRFDQKILAVGTYFNSKIITSFSNYLIQNIKLNNDGPTKLFLYRQQTHRTAKNQEELRQFLENEGFTSICLEKLTFEQQISLFYHAKFIIGISGAAWSNLIFCRNKPKAICFIPSNAKEFSAFSNLAHIFNVDFYANFYESNNKHESSDFEINLKTFNTLYTKLNG